MKAPTLGYEDDARISKSEMALVQLRGSIALFLRQEFLCALTLAGAAEAILAGLLAAKQERSVVEESADEALRVAKVGELVGLDGASRKDMFKAWNAGRNLAKHHGEGDADAVAINLFDESYWMIRRALSNAERLALAVDSAHDFEHWVVANINM